MVDSFNDPGTRIDGRLAPAARVYLDNLKVEADQVEAIVVTHFHADHIGGIDALHDYYATAKLFVTQALKEKTFRRLFDAQVDDTTAALTGTIARAERRELGANRKGLGWLQASSFVVRGEESSGAIEVLSLAPSDQAVTFAARELRNAMELDPRPPALVRRLRDENRTSSALHIQACGITALLGGDVVNEPGEFGWPAVLDDPRHEHLRLADVVKLAHHGSEPADHPRVWAELATQGATMLVTPFWPSSIPDPDFARRVAARGPLYQAASSTASVTDEDGQTQSAPASTGFVQARKKQGQEWTIGLHGPAVAVAT